MDGMTRRALKVVFDQVRRELRDATDEMAAAREVVGGFSVASGERNLNAEAARAYVREANDRIFEANIALSWLIEQALFAK